MATYISFLSFTEPGIKTIKDLPARIAAGRQAFEGNGGKLLNYYLTLGSRDAVVIMNSLMMKQRRGWHLRKQA
jgi:uncharacterized protein with GYD domain